MEHFKKRLVKNGIIIPVIIAVIMSALFFAVLSVFSDEFPFTDNYVSISDYEKAKIIEAEPIKPGKSEISKRDIPTIAPNTVIGEIEAKGVKMPLIYDANDVNAMGKMNISGDSRLFGETGTVAASCYKADANFLKSMSDGDTLNINTHYGGFTYEITKINTINDLSLVKKQGDGVGRALVLYTDNSDKMGITNEYLVITCIMTSGIHITE